MAGSAQQLSSKTGRPTQAAQAGSLLRSFDSGELWGIY